MKKETIVIILLCVLLVAEAAALVIQNRRYNALMSELADGIQVYYYDPLPAFMQDEKTVSKTLLRDGVHPSPAGYEVFAREIEKAIEQAHRQ